MTPLTTIARNRAGSTPHEVSCARLNGGIRLAVSMIVICESMLRVLDGRYQFGKQQLMLLWRHVRVTDDDRGTSHFRNVRIRKSQHKT